MSKLTPEENAKCHLRVYKCPGWAINGSLRPGCHPYHKPGGYDILFAMMTLNNEPFSSLEEVNEYLKYFISNLAIVIRYDREDLLQVKGYLPIILPCTEDQLKQPEPHPQQIELLKKINKEKGFLYFKKNDKFGDSMFEITPKQKLVHWDMVAWLERDGLIEKDIDGEIQTGTRFLTKRGAEFARSH